MADRVPVGYLRKSRVFVSAQEPDESDDAYRLRREEAGQASHDSQEAAIRSLAAKQGDEDRLVMLEDWGVSGSREKRHKRPGYNRLLEMVAADEVSAMYGYSLSRFSRSLPDFTDLAELASEHRVDVWLEKEGRIDLTSPTGRLMVKLLAMFAEFELELASERSTDAARALKARGVALGNAPFGMRKRGKRLVEDPHEQEIIAMIVEEYGRSRSLSGTATLLNDYAVPTKSGRGRWAPEVVKAIVARHAPGMFVVGVQQGSSGRGKTRFSGLLRCHCGGAMAGRFQRGRWESYSCKRGQVDRSHPRPITVSGAAVWDLVKLVVRSIRPKVESSQVLEARAAKIVQERVRLLDKIQSGVLEDDADIRARLEDIAARAHRVHSDQAMVLAVARPQTDDDRSAWNVWLRRVYSEIRLSPDMESVECVRRDESFTVLTGKASGTSSAVGTLSDAV